MGITGERLISASFSLDPMKVSVDLNGTYLHVNDDSRYNIHSVEVLDTTRRLLVALKDRGFGVVAHTAAFFRRIDQLEERDPAILELFDEVYTRESHVNRDAPPDSATALGRRYLIARQEWGDPRLTRWRYVTLGSDLSPENEDLMEKTAKNRDKLPAITGAATVIEDYKVRQLKPPMPYVQVIRPSRIPIGETDLTGFINENFVNLRLARSAGVEPATVTSEA